MRTDIGERFAALCEAERGAIVPGNSIGTYGEKRLHRVLKYFVCEDPKCHEISVGKYVADVREGNSLTEIQTGSFRPLLPKLRYYLSQTECQVTVLYPVIAEKMLIRVERESGEFLRKRRSSRHGRIEDLLPQLYWISEVLASPRLTIRVLLLTAEEFRYSERMRYRREGAYESDLFPGKYLGEQIFCGLDSYRVFLPEQTEFFAEDFRKQHNIKARAANAALQTFCTLGLLERQMVGRKYQYRTLPTK